MPALIAALAVGAGATLFQALSARVRNERVSASRARALAKMRIDWACLLRNRFNVLKCAGEGEETPWTNDFLQAVWGSAVAPVLAYNAPPLVDVALAQLMSTSLLPSWVTKLQLVKLDLGDTAPKLRHVRLPETLPNGTTPAGDLLLDFDVDVNLATDIVIQVMLETSMSRLVSRLTGRAQAASVRLHVSGVRQKVTMRLRSRPEHALLCLGLVRFRDKPVADVRLVASYGGGVSVSLPVSKFPGAELISGYVTTRLARELMGWADHRYLPLDLGPVIKLIQRPSDAGRASIPTGGCLRIQVLEARGLGPSGDGSIATPSLGSSSSVSGSVEFEHPLHSFAEDEPEGNEADEAHPPPLARTQSGTALAGGRVRPFARVSYAMGARSMRTLASAGGVDPAGCCAWAQHEGRLTVEMVGPLDALTVTLKRRTGPGGVIGSAHFKLIWTDDGSATLFYCAADGAPAMYRLAYCHPDEAARRAAGVPYSGSDGFAKLWLPLHSPSPSGAHAELRLQLSVDWFGSVRTHSPAETRAALVMQRFVRGWKARRRLRHERGLVAREHTGGPLQLRITLQALHGLPLKRGYAARCELRAGDGAGAAAAAAVAAAQPLHTQPCAEERSDPGYGETMSLLVPPGALPALAAAQVTLHLSVLRKGLLVATAAVPVPPDALGERGHSRRVRADLAPAPHFADLQERARHKLRARAAAGGGEEAEAPSATLYVCVVHVAEEGTAAGDAAAAGLASLASLSSPTRRIVVPAAAAPSRRIPSTGLE